MLCQARVSPVLGKAPSSICKGYVSRKRAKESPWPFSGHVSRNKPIKKERIAQKHRSKDQIQTEKTFYFTNLNKSGYRTIRILINHNMII